MKSEILFCLIVSVLFSTLSFAQPQEQNRFFTSGAGFAIPQGAFSSTDSATGGFARYGFLMRFNYSVNMKRNFGLTFRIQYSNNPVDTNSLIQTFYPGAYDIKISGWEIISFLGGIYLSFPIEDFYTADPHVMFGPSAIFSPQIQGPGATMIKEKAIGFASLVGISVRLLRKNMVYGFTLDYYTAKAHYKDLTVTDRYGYSIVMEANTKQSVKQLFLTGMIGIKLNSDSQNKKTKKNLMIKKIVLPLLLQEKYSLQKNNEIQ